MYPRAAFFFRTCRPVEISDETGAGQCFAGEGQTAGCDAFEEKTAEAWTAV